MHQPVEEQAQEQVLDDRVLDCIVLRGELAHLVRKKKRDYAVAARIQAVQRELRNKLHEIRPRLV